MSLKYLPQDVLRNVFYQLDTRSLVRVRATAKTLTQTARDVLADRDADLQTWAAARLDAMSTLLNAIVQQARTVPGDSPSSLLMDVVGPLAKQHGVTHTANYVPTAGGHYGARVQLQSVAPDRTLAIGVSTWFFSEGAQSTWRDERYVELLFETESHVVGFGLRGEPDWRTTPRLHVHTIGGPAILQRVTGGRGDVPIRCLVDLIRAVVSDECADLCKRLL